ncbi:putative short-chain dehydrogenase [Zopfia rhizophila CBS 207.26]|uniref:Putative short-chain dehydrogenase n=1 Tax=Zopfia rhizophila CBS 207.26 TaxID=1314779 RepID=A0A6A6DRW1_9PEZI|nr:putative short-chain dehydrogenase [Zopfia rhizophila CBS 207.26]
MSTSRHRFLPREGFCIGPFAKAIRKTLLSPWLTLTTLLFIRLSATIGKSSPSPISEDRRIFPIAICSLIGTLLDINDLLTKHFHNNWTTDPSWNWDSEIVLVTGGSSGIGASVVKQLIFRNPKTTIIVIDHVPLTFTPPSKNHLHFYRCDLSNSAEIKTVCTRVKKEVGNPTVVFNNAGLARGKTVIDGNYADIDITFRTNIIAPFLILKEFLPEMTRRNHGHVIATSSMSSIIPPAGLADYAATKAGLASLHESLALELKHKHNAPKVRTSLIILGFTETPMFKGRTNQAHFIVPLMNVDTVGEKIVDILCSGYGKNIYLPDIMR